MIATSVVLFSTLLCASTADFVGDLSPVDREEFLQINRENRQVTEKELMQKIGDWAKGKGLEKQWAKEREWKRREKGSLLRHIQNFQFGLVSTFDEIEPSMRDAKLSRQAIEKAVEHIFDTRTGSAVIIRKIMEVHRRAYDFDRQPSTKDDMKKHITHFASFSAAFLDVILKRTKRSVQKVPAMLAKLSASIRDDSATIAENGKQYEQMLDEEKDEGAQIAVETIFEMARMVAREERKREEKEQKTAKKHTEL